MDRVEDKREWHLTIVDNAILYSVQLSNYEKLTYVILCAYSNVKTGECYPSIKTIGELVGASKSTIKTAIKSLKDKGLITIQERKEGSLNKSNLYTLTKLPEWILQEYESRLAKSTPPNDLPRSGDNLGVGQEVTGGGSTDDPELKPFNYISCCSSKDIPNDSYGTVPNDCHLQDEQGTDPNTHLDKVIKCYCTMAGILETSVSGRDIGTAKRMLSKNMPVDFICKGIEHAFNAYKPSYEGEKINSLSYCEKVIDNLWANKKAKEETNGAGKQSNRQIPKKLKLPQQQVEEYTDEQLAKAGIK